MEINITTFLLLALIFVVIYRTRGVSRTVVTKKDTGLKNYVIQLAIYTIVSLILAVAYYLANRWQFLPELIQDKDLKFNDSFGVAATIATGVMIYSALGGRELKGVVSEHPQDQPTRQTNTVPVEIFNIIRMNMIEAITIVSHQRLNNYGLFTNEAVNRTAQSLLDDVIKIFSLCIGLDEKQSKKIHCCIKLICEKDYVYTLVRSPIPKERNKNKGDLDKHKIAENTSFFSIAKDWYPNSEGAWKDFGSARCFICTDLSKAQGYQNTRMDYKVQYNAVFSIPITINDKSLRGFLTLDTEESDLFKGLPNIYDYTSMTNGIKIYNEVIESLPVYIVMDTLCDLLARITNNKKNAYARRKQQ